MPAQRWGPELGGWAEAVAAGNTVIATAGPSAAGFTTGLSWLGAGKLVWWRCSCFCPMWGGGASATVNVPACRGMGMSMGMCDEYGPQCYNKDMHVAWAMAHAYLGTHHRRIGRVPNARRCHANQSARPDPGASIASSQTPQNRPKHTASTCSALAPPHTMVRSCQCPGAHGTP